MLIPGVLQPLPASLTQAIKQFATQLSSWLESSLMHFPEKLKQKKLEVASTFSKSLRRKTSLTHLAQAARTVLHSAEPVTQMVNDWQDIDFKEIIKQTLWTFSTDPEADCQVIETFLNDFTQLLEQQATIDQYAEWASNLVDTCIKKYFDMNTDQDKAKERSRQFLLKWSFFGTQVMRELTLKSAQSFGSFHLLHILLEDYIVYCVECKANQQSQDTSYENKVSTTEQFEPATEDMEVQEVCDIEVLAEAEQSPANHPSNEPNTLLDKDNSVPRRTTYTDVHPIVTRLGTPIRAPTMASSPKYNQQTNVTSTTGNIAPSVNLSMTTEGRSFPYYGPSNSESSIHSYPSTRGYNTLPTAPYGVLGAQNVIYGGMYGSMNGVCSSAELKAYTQYAMQENTSYPGRYFPPSVVPGSPVYSRNSYPANNVHYRDEQVVKHQGYERRFHSRVLGDNVLAQPPLLGAL